MSERAPGACAALKDIHTAEHQVQRFDPNTDILQRRPCLPGLCVDLGAFHRQQMIHRQTAVRAVRPLRVLAPSGIAAELDSRCSRQMVLVVPARLLLHLFHAVLQCVPELIRQVPARVLRHQFRMNDTRSQHATERNVRRRGRSLPHLSDRRRRPPADLRNDPPTVVGSRTPEHLKQIAPVWKGHDIRHVGAVDLDDRDHRRPRVLRTLRPGLPGRPEQWTAHRTVAACRFAEARVQAYGPLPEGDYLRKQRLDVQGTWWCSTSHLRTVPGAAARTHQRFHR